jgi:hypothetical protein
VALADPAHHYVSSIIDLDDCIGDLAEGRSDFRYCFVFIHNDAGVSYAATIAAISKAKLFTIVFGNEAEVLAGEVNFPAETLAAKAVHNPLALKAKIDRVVAWVASNR